MATYTGGGSLPDNPIAATLGTKPASKLPANPVAKRLAPSPLAARGGRGGPTPGTKPQTSSNLGLTPILHAAGIDPGYIKHVVQHPLAKLEGHGQFAVGGKYGPQVSSVPRQGYMKVGNKYVQVQGAQDIIQPPGAGGFIRGLAGGGETLARRTADEAAQHVLDSARNAKAEGFGPAQSGGVGNAPLVKKGEVTAGTGGELGAQVRGALKSSPQARAKQAALHSKQRSFRAAAAQTALDRGDFEGALRELKGALPKVDFQGFKQFDEPTARAMEAHLMQNSPLRTYETMNAIRALRDAVGGKVPAAYEQKLLERAFGKEIADQVSGTAGQIGKWGKRLVNAANVPRSIMASTDLSAPFRQGLVVGVSHPVMFGKAFGPMLRAARSEGYFQQAIQDEIHARPTFPLMDKAKVAFTDIGKDAKHGAAALNQREEAFMSNYAERIPGIGRIVRASDRAYVGFLNKIRADVFDHLVREAAQQGHDVNDPKFLTSLGKFVNSATGRGDLSSIGLANHTASLNALFFSPRLLASRINFLNPFYYASLHPFARREALKAFLSLGATASTILSVAKMGGAQVNLDPTNADFAKIKVGNERVDILGGFQQPVRLAAQLAENKITSSTTGKVIPLGPGFAKTSRFDVFMKFLEGKTSPIPSLVIASLKGQDFQGQPVKWSQLSTYEREATNYMLPFLAQDMYNIYTTSGPGAAGASVLPSLFGVGVQDYKAKTPTGGTGKPTGGYGGGSSGGYGAPTGGYGGSGTSGGY